MDNPLKKEAESLLGNNSDNEAFREKNVEELIHDLKIQQIELELQNEELMKTQEKLLISQQKYFELFDLAPVAYLKIDNITRIRDANLTAASLLKSDKIALSKKRFDSFIKPSCQDDFYLFVTNLTHRAKEMIHESCLNIEGKEIYVRIACNLEQSPDKQDEMLIRLTLTDITERILMEKQHHALNDELNARKMQLENFNRILEEKVSKELEKNRIKDYLMSLQSRHAAMGEMVGHIAHQWKQPLNTLNLIILDLQDAFHYNELTGVYLDKSVLSAKKVINHMAQTIDDFRNFFKPVKSKTWFDVGQQIQTAVSFIRTTIELAGIRIENNIEDGILAKGFPNEFSQVVINILNNAREALLVSQPWQPVIKMESRTVHGKVHILFLNNGGSIPPDVLPHIFEPYFSTKDHDKGTGIGLYLARTIITKNMNGNMEVKNTKDGVIFEIILPFKQ